MRVIFIIACVVVVDIVLLFIGWAATMEINGVAIARAVAAQSTNPGPESQQALDAATRAADVIRIKVRLVASAAMFLVTTIGCFTAGRHFERRRFREPTAPVSSRGNAST